MQLRGRGLADTQTDAGWQGRAAELHNSGGVPDRRAEVVALRENGLTHAAIADEIDISRSVVTNHLRAYAESLDKARWLLEHGPTSREL